MVVNKGFFIIMKNLTQKESIMGVVIILPFPPPTPRPNFKYFLGYQVTCLEQQTREPNSYLFNGCWFGNHMAYTKKRQPHHPP